MVPLGLRVSVINVNTTKQAEPPDMDVDRISQTTPDGEPLDATKILRSILVVDDSAAQRRLMTTTLRRRGYRVQEAASGQEALALSKTSPFDLVISDWMMPEMDCLALCRHLRDIQTDDYLYFILLTSKNEKAEIATGLDAGADDFLVKPVNGTELDARIRAGARVVALHRAIVQKSDIANKALLELRSVYSEIERDLRQAKVLQQSLLRTKDAQIGPAHVCMMLEACGHVGGDLVGFFPISTAELGVFALDVSGHGISAALLTARLAGLLSGTTPGQNLAIAEDANGRPVARNLGQVMGDMNALMLREMETDHYATLFLAVLNMRTGWLSAAQAGHPAGLLLREKGRVQRLGTGGLPIGLIEGAEFSSFRARMRPGDRLLLTSDGITEASGAGGVMFETAGLARWVQSNSDLETAEVLPKLVEDTRRFSGRARFEDDVSALVLDFQRKGRGADLTQTPMAHEFPDEMPIAFVA